MHLTISKKRITQSLILMIFLAFVWTGSALAEESTSTGYKVLDPVVHAGGYSTSTGFSLFGVISEVASGTSTAISSFSDNAGFLFFPFASTPVISAAAGNAQVSLSWTASTGYLGWTASSYAIGRFTVSGGPYSYTSLGNVTSSTVTGLSNATTYYFVIIVKDAFNNAVATSSQVSSTPVAPPPSGGGGGGGGSGSPPATGTSGVVFSGRAYPGSTVTLLKDAQVAATTIAGSDANFQMSVSSISAGNYTFSLYSEDDNGNRSSLLTFPVAVTMGITANVTGVFIAPTIAVDKSQVKQGDNIVIFGRSAPAAEVTININSDQPLFVKRTADAAGAYLLNFDSSVLEMGSHTTRSKSAVSNEISSFSKTVAFTVGTENVEVPKPENQVQAKVDVNKDGKVNLIDFSIAAYWYKRPSPPANVDLNKDGKVDLIDFSIMAYYWTG